MQSDAVDTSDIYFQGKNTKGSYKDNRKLNKSQYWLTKGKWEIRPCPLRGNWFSGQENKVI